MRHPVDKIESGTVFRMWQDGVNYEILANEQAPEVYGVGSDSDDGLLIDSDVPWFTVTTGMTGQYGYDGPIMHDSEFISEGMIEQILSDHDYRSHYFMWTPVFYDDDNSYEGWVILARNVR